MRNSNSIYTIATGEHYPERSVRYALRHPRSNCMDAELYIERRDEYGYED